MPEIKNNFTRGIMNKDLDERLVPNGQYIHAENIQVSTSEGAEVGVVTNLKGNFNVASFGPQYKVVGTIADEKNDKLYWLVSGETTDFIAEYNVSTSTSQLVVVDTNKQGEKAFLKFDNKIITGINVIDEFLVWTDNKNEPKKININRSKLGTVDINTHTKLVVDGNLTVDLQERHITVIKQKPLAAPAFRINTDELRKASNPIFERTLPRFSLRYKYIDNEYSAIGPFTSVAFNPLVKEGFTVTSSYSRKEGYNVSMENCIDSIDLMDFVPNSIPEDVVQVDLLYKQENSAVVYSIASIKYTDPEWSAKGSGSVEFPNATGAAEVGTEHGYYKITSESLYAALPESQVLRSWDSVPRKALAQEITGNRLVYGNYFQGYDVNESPKVVSGYSLKDVVYQTSDLNPYRGLSSVKSEREYQVGVVFGDKYGRETPVFSAASSSLTVPFFDTSGVVSLNPIIATAKVESNAPSWAEYYKYYIKETSSEYNNILIDKAYDPATYSEFDNEEGHVWVSLNSFDVNKVSEEDYITLKKVIQNNDSQHIALENTYKVLTKETTAVPDAIRYKFISYGSISNLNSALTPLFVDSNHRIDQVTNKIIISKADFLAAGGSVLAASVDVTSENVYISWRTDFANSKRYRVAEAALELQNYSLTLAEVISVVDAEMASATGVAGTSNVSLATDVKLFVEKKSEKQLEQFSGKFFIKIVADEIVNTSLIQYNNQEIESFSFVQSQGIHWFAEPLSEDNGENGILNIDPYLALDPTTTIGDIANENTDGLSVVEGANAWQNIVDSTSVQSRFFIDNMRFVAGQSAANNYASYSGPVMNGGSSVYFHKPEWLSNLVDNEDYENIIDAWDLPYSRPYQGYVGSPLVDFIANGLDGIVEATADHTATYGFEGFRRWTGENIFDLNPVSTNSVYGAPGEEGRIFMHLSFLAPGEDLHDNDWGTAAAGLHGTYPWGPDGIAKYMQGIWGGGVFTRENGEPLQDAQGAGQGAGRFIEFESNWGDIQSNILQASISSNIGQPPASPGVGIGYDSNYTQRHQNQWNVNSSDISSSTSDFVSSIVEGNVFKFSDDTSNTQYTILGVQTKKIYNHTPWRRRYVWNPTTSQQEWGGDSVEEAALVWADLYWNQGEYPNYGRNFGTTAVAGEMLKQKIVDFGAASNRRLTYIIELDNNPVSATVDFNPLAGGSDNLDATTTTDIQIIGGSQLLTGAIIRNPSVAEVLPKNKEGLNIYYEAGNSIPLVLNEKTAPLFAPIGCKVEFLNLPQATSGSRQVDYPLYLNNYKFNDNQGEVLIAVRQEDGNNLAFNYLDQNGLEVNYNNSKIKFTRPDGSYTIAEIVSSALHSNVYDEIESRVEFIVNVNVNVSNEVGLNWNNCFIFKDGVESNRIRDDFNEMSITNGARASTTIEEQYKEEHRKNGLIYSGIYNSSNATNRLNEFISSQKITKDLNPTYGSIQKLFSRNTDLISFCEDRVIKILANKDALFNADGNPQLVSTNNVLGQSVPFSGDYGISKNPESFTSESYRAYFTDKQRGAVLRLSMDGLTPISDFGMRDFFRDNLREYSKLLGTYDEYKKEYNLTLDYEQGNNVIENNYLSEGQNVIEIFSGGENVVNPAFNLGSNINIDQNLDNSFQAEGTVYTNNSSFSSDVDIINISPVLAGQYGGEEAIPAVDAQLAEYGSGYEMWAFGITNLENSYDYNANGVYMTLGSDNTFDASAYFNSFTSFNNTLDGIVNTYDEAVALFASFPGALGIVFEQQEDSDNAGSFGASDMWVRFPEGLTDSDFAVGGDQYEANANIGLNAFPNTALTSELINSSHPNGVNYTNNNNLDVSCSNISVFPGEEIMVEVVVSHPDGYPCCEGHGWKIGLTDGSSLIDSSFLVAEDEPGFTAQDIVDYQELNNSTTTPASSAYIDSLSGLLLQQGANLSFFGPTLSPLGTSGNLLGLQSSSIVSFGGASGYGEGSQLYNSGDKYTLRAFFKFKNPENPPAAYIASSTSIPASYFDRVVDSLKVVIGTSNQPAYSPEQFQYHSKNVVHSVRIVKMHDLTQRPAAAYAGLPAVDPIPAEDIPGWAQVTLNAPASWIFSQDSNGMFIDSTYGALTQYGQDSSALQSELLSSDAGEWLEGDITEGNGVIGFNEYGDSTYPVFNPKIRVKSINDNGSSGGMAIKQDISSEPFVVDNWYMVDAEYDINDNLFEGATPGQNYPDGVSGLMVVKVVPDTVQVGASGALNNTLAEADTAHNTSHLNAHPLYPDGSFGHIVGNNVVGADKHFSMMEAQSTEFSFENPKSVHRCIFQYKSNSGASTDLLWLQSWGQNWVYKSIRVVDITSTVNGGNVYDWNTSSNMPTFDHGLDNYSQSMFYNQGGFNWNIPQSSFPVSGGFYTNNKWLSQPHSSGTDSHPFLTYTESGYKLKFVMDNNDVTNTFEGEAILFVHNHEEVAGSRGKGITMKGIDKPGVYEFLYNYDDSQPVLVQAPNGSSIEFANTYDQGYGGSSGLSKIMMRPQGSGGYFVGKLSSLSIQEQSTVFTGGNASSWVTQNVETEEDQTVSFFDGEIVFNNAEQNDLIRQTISPSLQTNSSYTLEFSYNNFTQGKLSFYYFNESGQGFSGFIEKTESVPSSGTYVQTFTIGDNYGVGAIWESLVFFSSTESATGDNLVVNIDNIELYQSIVANANFEARTITFNEESKGWTSFKSYVPTHGISASSKYFTFKDASLFEHYHELAEINNWYNQGAKESVLSFVSNQGSSTIKSFKYLSYEGSRTEDAALGVSGWKVDSIITDFDTMADIYKFVKKEGKWFNHVYGTSSYTNGMLDSSRFNVQGLGRVVALQTVVNGDIVDEFGVQTNTVASPAVDNIPPIAPASILNQTLSSTSSNVPSAPAVTPSSNTGSSSSGY